MARQIPLRSLPGRTLDFITARTTRFGERHGLDWLTYSPLQMLAYHRLALGDAPAVIGSLLEVFPDEQVIADVGCGSGAFAAELKRRGRAVFACEHAPGGRLAARLQGVPVAGFDLDREPPAGFGAPIDLAYCFEVAEHCTGPQGDRLVRFLGGLAPTVVFTAAHPGQGGLGHINEQEQSYWIIRFEQAGVSFSPELTRSLQQAFADNGVTAPWFAENVMVFKRAHRGQGSVGAQAQG